MSFARAAILFLFFASITGAVVFYVYGQPGVGRWFLLGIVPAWLLLSKISPDDNSPNP